MPFSSQLGGPGEASAALDVVHQGYGARRATGAGDGRPERGARL